MKKILDLIPCVSLVGQFVYLIQDYIEQKMEEDVGVAIETL